MKINLTSVLVDDQAKALDFYTRTLGFEKKNDVPLGEHRWLTVVSPEDRDGPELLLEPDEHPAAGPFKRALAEDGIPFASFAVDDVAHESKRLSAHGVRFTQEPTAMGPVVTAVLDDTCGNLIQITSPTESTTPKARAMTRTDRASQVIAAPPDRVFAAMVDPDALAKWLPPDGMSGRFERFDARPGGSYRLVLTYADASSAPGKATPDSDIVEARFVEVVHGTRLVQTVDFVSDDPAHAGTMTMTWEITTIDEGTRVEFRAEDVPDGISAEDHAAGLRSSLANLASYLAP